MVVLVDVEPDGILLLNIRSYGIDSLIIFVSVAIEDDFLGVGDS